jgi:hypothetical protein
MPLHPGLIQNLAVGMAEQRPVLPLRETKIQFLAIAFTGDAWVVTKWGDGDRSFVVTREPLSKPTAFKPKIEVTAELFELIVQSEEELAKHSQESLMETARVYAAKHRLMYGNLLSFNRALLHLQALRLGVILTMFDYPAVSPLGSEIM